MKIRDIPLDVIEPSNPLLREIDGGIINDLRESIKEQGVLQPILVRPDKDSNQYRIVFGNHRYFACKGAGLKTIPCIVSKILEEDAIILALTENIQRLRMDPFKEGEAYAKTGLKTKVLAKRLGKSKAYIHNRIKLWKDFHPDLRKELGKSLTLANAIRLCQFLPERQLQLCEKLKETQEHWKNSQSRYGFKPWGSQSWSDCGSQYCICPACGYRHMKQTE